MDITLEQELAAIVERYTPSDAPVVRRPHPVPRFRPMLASRARLERFPSGWLASEKLDGVRVMVWPDGRVTSRELLPFPQPGLAPLLTKELRVAADRGLMIEGELWAKGRSLDQIRAWVQSSKPKSSNNIGLHVFDCLPMSEFASPHTPLLNRLGLLAGSGLTLIPQQTAHNTREALAIFAHIVDRSGEGVVLADPDAAYHLGRCLPGVGRIKIKP